MTYFHYVRMFQILKYHITVGFHCAIEPNKYFIKNIKLQIKALICMTKTNIRWVLKDQCCNIKSPLIVKFINLRFFKT